MAVNWICILFLPFGLNLTSLLLFVSPSLSLTSPYCCPQQKHALFPALSKSMPLFAALHFALCMHTPMLLPHVANWHATANSGEKKKRREVKLSHKEKKEKQIKFPVIPGFMNIQFWMSYSNFKADKYLRCKLKHKLITQWV